MGTNTYDDKESLAVLTSPPLPPQQRPHAQRLQSRTRRSPSRVAIAKRRTTVTRRHSLAEVENVGGETQARSGPEQSQKELEGGPIQPPDTNPDRIDDLWRQVRTSIMTLGNNNKSPMIRTMPHRQAKGRPASRDSDDDDSVEGSVTGSPITSTTLGSARMNPRHPGFRDQVLRPRRIAINLWRDVIPSPNDHFNTTEVSNHHELETLGHMDAWLDIDEESCNDIHEEYKEMSRLDLCEEEFIAFAKENILKGQRRGRKPREDGHLRVQRMVQLVSLPDDGQRWFKPPVLDEQEPGDDVYSYRWDVRPDASYWLVTRGFDRKYRYMVDKVTYAVNNIITCPYLTIEFTREDECVEAAITRVAVAGALALYNRFVLWKPTLDADTDSIGQAPTPFDCVRHYGLAFCGGRFSIWVLRADKPSAEGDWNGCVMGLLDDGDLCDESSHVENLMRWINEIHRWGLTVHKRSCETEIKLKLGASRLASSTFEQ